MRLRTSASDVALQMFGASEEPKIHVEAFTGDCSLVFDWVFVSFSQFCEVAGLATEKWVVGANGAHAGRAFCGVLKFPETNMT